MKGKIIDANKARTRFAVRTDNGCTVFVADDPELAMGDEITGQLELIGPQQIETPRGLIDVHIDDFNQSPEEASRWVWNT